MTLGQRLACFIVGLVCSVGPADAARSRFDGHWIAVVDCANTADARGYNWTFPVDVADGFLHGVRGTVGTPSSMTLEGRIGDDGAALLSAVGLTGEPVYSVGQVPRGRTFNYRASIRFAGNHGDGFRTETRPCHLTFDR